MGPAAHVVIQYCCKDDRGTTFITADCVSQEEWDRQVDRLQQELEVIREEGHRRFASSRTKTKNKDCE